MEPRRAQLHRGHRRRAIRAVAPALLLAALFAWPGLAHADGNRSIDPVGDTDSPSAGNPADYDIVNTTVREKDNGRIVHRIAIYGRARVEGTGTYSSGVRIAIDAVAGASGYCADSARDPLGRADYALSTESDGVLFDCTQATPTATPVAMKRGRRFVKFTVRPDLIGAPRRYGWFASTGEGARIVDVSPYTEGDPVYRIHELRKGGDGDRVMRRCGDLEEGGAGVYDVRARRVRCGRARKVARRAWYDGEDRFGGWRCHRRQRGEESFRVRCVKRKDGREKIVRFDAGA